MKLTVHIGTTKTGSTSLQDFLVRNRAVLRKHGLLVPKSLGEGVHRKAVLASLDYGTSGNLFERAGVRSEADLEVFRLITVRDYRKELSEARDAREVVVTSEHLQSRIHSVDQVRRFRDLFASGFASCRIVVYVRPQLDQLVSLYSTVLRNGYAGTLQEHIESHTQRHTAYFDLRRLIDRWSRVFGGSAVVVRPYKEASGNPGGVVGDFCRLLDLPIDLPGLEQPRQSNSSINVSGQELLRIVNAQAEVPGELRNSIIAWLERNCPGPGELPDLDLARAFQDRFTESNAWVVSRYFPDHPEYLRPRWPSASAGDLSSNSAPREAERT